MGESTGQLLSLNQLFAAEPVFFTIGAVATLVFIFKLGLLVFAGVSKDLDYDFGGEGDVEGEIGIDDADIEDLGGKAVHSFKLLSTLTLLAFLMGFGWLGVAARTQWGFGHALAAAVAAAFGVIMMGFAAILAYQIQRLNKIPTHNKWSAVGSEGRVYLTVPARGHGVGQVEVLLSHAKRVLPAVNEGDEPVASHEPVIITGIADGKVVVKKKS